MMLISPIFVKTIRKFPIEMILFALFFFITGFRPIIVHSQALLFWTLGFLWAEFDLDIFELCDKCKWKILLPIFCGFVIMNKFFLTPPLYAFSVFASIIIMLKFSKTLIKNENFFAILKYLSGFSFFLFAIHNSKFMEFFKTIWIYFLPMKNPLFCLLEYFGVSILVCLSGTAIGICLKKLCPKVFKILTGGR